MTQPRKPTQRTVAFGDTKAGNTHFASGSFAAVVFTAPLGGKAEELVIGSGIRNLDIAQEHNVENAMALGWGDIAEVVSHGVRDNSLMMEKMMLKARQAAKVGLANFGIDNLAAPTLNAVIFDSLWEEHSGAKRLEYVKMTGLHLRSNRMRFAPGAIVGESLGFAVTRFERFQPDDYAHALFEVFQTKYAELYQAYQKLQSFSFTN